MSRAYRGAEDTLVVGPTFLAGISPLIVLCMGGGALWIAYHGRDLDQPRSLELACLGLVLVVAALAMYFGWRMPRRFVFDRSCEQILISSSAVLSFARARAIPFGAVAGLQFVRGSARYLPQGFQELNLVLRDPPGRRLTVLLRADTAFEEDARLVTTYLGKPVFDQRQP